MQKMAAQSHVNASGGCTREGVMSEECPLCDVERERFSTFE